MGDDFIAGRGTRIGGKRGVHVESGLEGKIMILDGACEFVNAYR
jgi:hypothetical protein